MRIIKATYYIFRVALMGLALFFASPSAYGQNQSLSAIVEGSESSSLSSALTATSAQSFHYQNDPKKFSQGELLFASTYTLESGFGLGGLVQLTQGTIEGGSTLLSDAQLRASLWSVSLAHDLTWKPFIQLTLPTSAGGQQEQALYTAVQVSQVLNQKIEIGGPAFALTYVPSVKKNFHQYTLDANGAANVEYMLLNTLSATLQAAAGTSFFASYTYVQAWTYRQFERKSFASSVGIDQALTKSLSASLALATGGAALKPSGIDSNISFFDERTSTFRGGLTYVF